MLAKHRLSRHTDSRNHLLILKVSVPDCSVMAGHHNEASVFSAMDLVPSLLKIAVAKPPESVVFDGENVADTLLGKCSASRSAPLIWRRPPERKFLGPNRRPQPDLAVREGNLKLLCEYDGSSPKLFDLVHDPAETTNIAEQHPRLVQRLMAAALGWHQSMPPDKGVNYISAAAGTATQ